MLRAVLVAAALAWPGLSAAQAPLFDRAALDEAARMVPAVRRMLAEDIPATLPRADRPRAAAIRLATPDRLGPHPMGVYAEPTRNTIHVPLETLRFLDEWMMLLGWDNSRDCRSEFFDSYLWALLRAREPLPGPLAAFALDRAAVLADPKADHVAERSLSSAVWFLLAHEVGHILLGHSPDAQGADSRRQEMEADAFALDRFAALGTAPLGIVPFFYAARYLDPTGEAAELGTHPVFSRRLQAIADRLAAEPEAFAHAEPDPAQARLTVLFVAAQIGAMAELGSDEDMLEVLPGALLRDYPLSRLATACPK